MSKTPGLTFSKVKHKCYWLVWLVTNNSVGMIWPIWEKCDFGSFWYCTGGWFREGCIPGKGLMKGQWFGSGHLFEKSSWEVWEVHHRLSRSGHIQAKSFPVHFPRLPNATHTHWIQERTVCSKKHYSICHHRFHKNHASKHTYMPKHKEACTQQCAKTMNTGTKL